MENKITYNKRLFIVQGEGAFLDNYSIIKQLGSGGYGKVYQAKNKKTGEVRACKHLTKMNIKNMEKFKREIEILMNTDHPNIIKLYEVFESARSFYLVMEQCEGGEVFDRITEHIQKKEMYSEKDAAMMFLQMMSSIEYCHNNGICHRDLKPENLLYLYKGEEKNNPIKVIDFGLSQIIPEEKSSKMSSRVGTAYYIAPEVLIGSYSEKCDIWSAGVILYIFLSGVPPFNGANDNIIYSKIRDMKYSFPSSKWGNISKEAMDLIGHMLLPENERYTAKQVLEHPWLNNAQSFSLTKLPFDVEMFQEFYFSCGFRRMVLTFIASKLSDNDINELKKTFIAFDKGNDGQISYSEFKQGLMQLKSGAVNQDEIKGLFSSIDTDKNGRIDYTEFIASTLDRHIYLQKEKLFEAFAAFDLNGDGYITKEELMKVLKLEANQLVDVDALIKRADKNGDGKIDYKEFLLLMNNGQ